VKGVEQMIVDRRSHPGVATFGPHRGDASGPVKVECRAGDRVTIAVEGNLAHQAWLVQLIRTIFNELEESRPARFTVDLGRVTGFDAQAASLWVGLERYLRVRGCELAIVQASPEVLRFADTGSYRRSM
jgi:ABC-type transporter Mla MlaB component